MDDAPPFSSQAPPQSISLADLAFTDEERTRIHALLCKIGVPSEKHRAYQEDLVGLLYTLLDAYFQDLKSPPKEPS